jgi:hypothetical protein
MQPEFADTMDESRKRDVPTASAENISSPLGMPSHELSVLYHLMSLYLIYALHGSKNYYTVKMKMSDWKLLRFMFIILAPSYLLKVIYDT